MSEQIKESFCQPFSERALLAYCFKDINSYHNILSRLSDTDFLRPEHRLIWAIMGTLVKRDVKSFDISMIIDEAQKSQVLDKVGGYEYVTACAHMDLAGSNLEYYIDKVLNASTKYQLYMKLNYDLRKISNESSNDDVQADDLLGLVTSDVLELSLRSNAVKEATNLSDGIDEYIEERRSNPVNFCGISTGYEILDFFQM